MDRRQFLSSVSGFGAIVPPTVSPEGVLRTRYLEWIKRFRGRSADLLGDERFLVLIERYFENLKLEQGGDKSVCELIRHSLGGISSDVAVDRERYIVASVHGPACDSPAALVWIDTRAESAADPMIVVTVIDQGDRCADLFIISNRHIHNELKRPTFEIPVHLKRNFRQWFQGQRVLYENIEFCNWISREGATEWIAIRSKIDCRLKVSALIGGSQPNDDPAKT
jgi:hypothetical protein